MYFIYYLVLPLLVAWKKRSASLADEMFSLYTTMLGAFLAIWCEGFVRNSIGTLMPPDKSIIPWLRMGTLILIWLITAVAVRKIIECLMPEGTSNVEFPNKVEKFAVPVVVFLHTGLICALIFTILAVSPVKQYVPFILENKTLCSATRYRMLWNSFFIDRFSWQSVTVTQRRRSFDSFVPEDPQKASQAKAPAPKSRKGK